MFQPYLAIHSSRKEPLEYLAKVFPGYIQSKNVGENYQPANYPRWILGISKSLTCFKFLSWIGPYLEYTKSQAEVFDKFLRQKREVRRELEGLSRVPQLYLTPYDRIVVEQQAQNDLNAAKAQTAGQTHLPQPPRLAGILDAAGYFGVYATTRQDLTQLYSNYDAHCGLTSVHQGLVQALYETYNGSKPAEGYKRIDRYAGPSFIWQISGSGFLTLLEDINPYLIFNRTEAELITDFLQTRQLFMRNPTENPVVYSQRCQVLRAYVDLWQQFKKPGLSLRNQPVSLLP